MPHTIGAGESEGRWLDGRKPRLRFMFFKSCLNIFAVLSSQKFPKYRYCLYGGRVWPLPGFFWRICPHALRAIKGDHLSPTSDISTQKCSLFTRIYHDLRIFVDKMLRVAFTHFYGPNRPGCLPGCQPNLGDACIFGNIWSWNPSKSEILVFWHITFFILLRRWEGDDIWWHRDGDSDMVMERMWWW